MSEFQVHPKLVEDCVYVGEGPLSRVLLMNDARYPWLILVPRIDGLRDLHDVPDEDRTTLFDEIDGASRVVQALVDADKVNVAALGNQVPQLHVHVIGRLVADAAWPGPVWGVGESTPYETGKLETVSRNIKERMRL